MLWCFLSSRIEHTERTETATSLHALQAQCNLRAGAYDVVVLFIISYRGRRGRRNRNVIAWRCKRSAISAQERTMSRCFLSSRAGHTECTEAGC